MGTMETSPAKLEKCPRKIKLFVRASPMLFFCGKASYSGNVADRKKRSRKGRKQKRKAPGLTPIRQIGQKGELYHLSLVWNDYSRGLML